MASSSPRGGWSVGRPGCPQGVSVVPPCRCDGTPWVKAALLAADQSHGHGHGHGHTDTITRTRTHGHGHTDTDTRTQSHRHGHTDTVTQTRTHGHGHTYTDTRTRSHGHGHTDTDTRTRTHGHGHTDTVTLIGHRPQTRQPALIALGDDRCRLTGGYIRWAFRARDAQRWSQSVNTPWTSVQA